MRFGDLRFVVTTEDGLERVCSFDCFPDTASSGPVIDTLRVLRLGAPGLMPLGVPGVPLLIMGKQSCNARSDGRRSACSGTTDRPRIANTGLYPR